MVTAINDQHSFLAVQFHTDLLPGDLHVCDVVHPCTTFDKWRLIPVVDEAYTVVDTMLTFFIVLRAEGHTIPQRSRLNVSGLYVLESPHHYHGRPCPQTP